MKKRIAFVSFVFMSDYLSLRIQKNMLAQEIRKYEVKKKFPQSPSKQVSL